MDTTRDDEVLRLRQALSGYQAIAKRLDAYTAELEAETGRLRAALALDRAVSTAVPVPVLVVDTAGRLLSANPAAAALFGIARPLDPAHPPLCASVVACRHCFQDACPLRADAPATCDITRTAPDAPPRTFQLAAAPVYNEAGERTATVLVFMDVTTRQALIDALTAESV